MTRLADFSRLLAGRYGNAPRAVPKPGGIDAAPAAMLPEPVLEDLYSQPSLPVAAASATAVVRQTTSRQQASESAETGSGPHLSEPAVAITGRPTQRHENDTLSESRHRPAAPPVSPPVAGAVVTEPPAMPGRTVPEGIVLPGNAKPRLPPTLQALTTIAQRGEAEIKPAAEAPSRSAEVEPAKTLAGPDLVLPPTDFARSLPQAVPQGPMPAGDARMRPAPTPPPVAPTLSIGRINIKVVAAPQAARKVESAPSVSRSASIAWRRAGVGKL